MHKQFSDIKMSVDVDLNGLEIKYWILYDQDRRE